MSHYYICTAEQLDTLIERSVAQSLAARQVSEHQLDDALSAVRTTVLGVLDSDIATQMNIRREANHA